jgi:hypothetical protein
VRLIMLVLNMFPVWWPFLVASYKRNHPSVELLVVHANVSRPALEAPHVTYAELSVAALTELFAAQLGIAPERVGAKLASAKGLSDLKPFYGKVFERWLPEGEGGVSHWGWGQLVEGAVHPL